MERRHTRIKQKIVMRITEYLQLVCNNIFNFHLIKCSFEFVLKCLLALSWALYYFKYIFNNNNHGWWNICLLLMILFFLITIKASSIALNYLWSDFSEFLCYIFKKLRWYFNKSCIHNICKISEATEKDRVFNEDNIFYLANVIKFWSIDTNVWSVDFELKTIIFRSCFKLLEMKFRIEWKW